MVSVVRTLRPTERRTLSVASSAFCIVFHDTVTTAFMYTRHIFNDATVRNRSFEMCVHFECCARKYTIYHYHFDEPFHKMQIT